MSYTASKAQSGLGTVIAINTSATSTPTWTTIGEILQAPWTGRQNRTADVTNLQSSAVEWIATLVSSGQLDISCNRVSTDPGQAAVEASFSAKTIKQYQITLPLEIGQSVTGDLIAFSALVEESNQLGELTPEKQVVYKFRLKVSGAVTTTEGS